MLNISLKDTRGHYNENPQKNPILWRFMYKQEDGSFVDQAGWMKCKDFFNDVVAKFTGNIMFPIYGFNNKSLKKNKEGFYVLVKNITDRESFFHNLDKVLYPKLKQELSCEFSWEEADDGLVMLLFPNEVLKSTYYISLLTLVIRCSNYGKKADSWDKLIDIVEEEETNGKNHFSNQDPEVIAEIRASGFAYEPASNYWWYYNEKYNNKELPTQGSHMVHNCGIAAWILGVV